MKKFATLGHKLFHNVHECELKRTLGYAPNKAKLLLALSNIHCVSFFESTASPNLSCLSADRDLVLKASFLVKQEKEDSRPGVIFCNAVTLNII